MDKNPRGEEFVDEESEGENDDAEEPRQSEKKKYMMEDNYLDKYQENPMDYFPKFFVSPNVLSKYINMKIKPGDYPMSPIFNGYISIFHDQFDQPIKPMEVEDEESVEEVEEEEEEDNNNNNLANRQYMCSFQPINPHSGIMNNNFGTRSFAPPQNQFQMPFLPPFLRITRKYNLDNNNINLDSVILQNLRENEQRNGLSNNNSNNNDDNLLGHRQKNRKKKKKVNEPTKPKPVKEMLEKIMRIVRTNGPVSKTEIMGIGDIEEEIKVFLSYLFISRETARTKEKQEESRKYIAIEKFKNSNAAEYEEWKNVSSDDIEEAIIEMLELRSLQMSVIVEGIKANFPGKKEIVEFCVRYLKEKEEIKEQRHERFSLVRKRE